MKILITGGTGFIGSRLVESLSKDNKLIVLSRKKIKSQNKNIIFLEGSLEDKNSLLNATKSVDIVIHCAALLGGSLVSYNDLERVNVLGTKNLLDACLINNIKKIVHISSVAVFGIFDGIVNEKTICKPFSDYDKTKYDSEKLVIDYFKKGLDFVIIRPSMVYGPGEEKNKAKLFRYVQNKKFWIIGDGKNKLALIYIDNLVDGIILALKNRKAIGQIYILSDEKNYTLGGFIKIIADELDMKLPFKIPKPVAYLFAIPLEILSFFKINVPLTFSRIRTLTSNRGFNISKAKKELNYHPKINLEEGVKKTIKWYKQKKILN